MREPEFSHATGILQYRKWALENKKRADRLLVAAKALNEVVWDKLTEHGADYESMSELWNAAVDYEDQVG